MDMQMVSTDLEDRISAGKAWLESRQGLVLDGPQLRKCPTRIHLSQFLDTSDRVERFGLGFHVTVETRRGPRTFQLNVRVKPSLSAGPKADSHPYVVMYVVIQATAADDEIIHETFLSPKQYVNFSNLSVQDWYMHWVNQALRTESGKFFTDEVLVR